MAFESHSKHYAIREPLICSMPQTLREERWTRTRKPRLAGREDKGTTFFTSSPTNPHVIEQQAMVYFCVFGCGLPFVIIHFRVSFNETIIFGIYALYRFESEHALRPKKRKAAEPRGTEQKIPEPVSR